MGFSHGAMLFVSLICKKATGDPSSSTFLAYYVVSSLWLSPSKQEPAENSFTMSYNAHIVRAPSLHKKKPHFTVFLRNGVRCEQESKKPNWQCFSTQFFAERHNPTEQRATAFQGNDSDGKFHWKSCSFTHELPGVNNKHGIFPHKHA